MNDHQINCLRYLGGSSEGLAERRPPGGVLQAGILHGLCSARETVTLDGM